MTTHATEIDEKITFLRDQITDMQALAGEIGASAEDAARPYFDMLQSLYVTDLPLARMLDNSDLIVHLEGPAVRDEAPQLAAVNWLAATALKSLRSLSAGVFDLTGHDARAFMRLLDLRLTGFAPGSLYAGFALRAPPDDLLPAADEPVVRDVRDAIRQLPRISVFIGDDGLDAGIRDELPDPARRDNALTALLRLTPTGKLGVHSLVITAPGAQSATLSQRERTVLQAAVARPQLNRRKHGAFTGELLEIDLSSRRFHVRNIPHVGTLRCVAPTGFERVHAKAALGEQVRVTGDYETDRSGRPRLMLVQTIKPLPAPAQDRLPMASKRQRAKRRG